VPAPQRDAAARQWLADALVDPHLPADRALLPDAIEVSRAERLHLLLADVVGRAHAWPADKAVLRAGLVAETRAAAVDDMARTRELVRVVERLEVAGCAPVVFKGAALAHSHYPQPWLRARVDTDVLVSEATRAPAADVFTALGYRRAPLVSGRLVMYQEMFVREEAGGLEHVFDLHWRVTNPQATSLVLTHDRLRGRATSVAVPGGVVQAPCPADALVLACVHRAAHHQDAQDLLWLYDIHLLARGLTQPEWADATATAVASAVTALCARGLQLAGERFRTRVPAFVSEALGQGPANEASAVFLRPDLTPAARLRSDLRALSRLDRARLLVEVVLPPRDYMRAAFGGGLLPWLYVRRLVRGAGKWLRPIRTQRREDTDR
jgi:hypothetical protein